MPDRYPTLSARDLRGLESNHQGLLSMCLDLEQAMDELEHDMVLTDLHRLADSIVRCMKEAHDLEERILFPDFDRRAGSCFSAMIIEQLKADHRYDSLAAEELSLTLRALAEGRCRLSFETIVCMLGGFLECLRRHVSTEKMMIEALLVAEAEGREIFA